MYADIEEKRNRSLEPDIKQRYGAHVQHDRRGPPTKCLDAREILNARKSKSNAHHQRPMKTDNQFSRQHRKNPGPNSARTDAASFSQVYNSSDTTGRTQNGSLPSPPPSASSTSGRQRASKAGRFIPPPPPSELQRKATPRLGSVQLPPSTHNSSCRPRSFKPQTYRASAPRNQVTPRDANPYKYFAPEYYNRQPYQHVNLGPSRHNKYQMNSRGQSASSSTSSQAAVTSFGDEYIDDFTSDNLALSHSLAKLDILYPAFGADDSFLSKVSLQHSVPETVCLDFELRSSPSSQLGITSESSLTASLTLASFRLTSPLDKHRALFGSLADLVSVGHLINSQIRQETHRCDSMPCLRRSQSCFWSNLLTSSTAASNMNTSSDDPGGTTDE